MCIYVYMHSEKVPDVLIWSFQIRTKYFVGILKKFRIEFNKNSLKEKKTNSSKFQIYFLSCALALPLGLLFTYSFIIQLKNSDCNFYERLKDFSLGMNENWQMRDGKWEKPQ